MQCGGVVGILSLRSDTQEGEGDDGGIKKLVLLCLSAGLHSVGYGFVPMRVIGLFVRVVNFTFVTKVEECLYEVVCVYADTVESCLSSMFALRSVL